MNAIFYNDEILNQFEKDEQWDKCIEYLVALVKRYSDSVDIYLRLLAQCWYLLTFEGITIIRGSFNRKVVVSYLKYSYRKIIKRWENNPNCLWIIGYFICINTIEFLFIDSYYNVQKIGYDLIEKAYSIDKTNIFTQYHHFLNLTDREKSIKNTLTKNLYFKLFQKRKYTNIKNAIKNNMNTFFPSSSLIDQYFKDIFSCNY